MSWTQVFPVLTEEMVEEYELTAPPDEREELAGLFGVARWMNRRRDAQHVVSTSLFWKNAREDSPPLPEPTRELMVNAAEEGLAERFAPWQHYIEPVLQAAEMLSMTNPEAVFRVYLAADLAFLVPELTDAGCEIALMRHSSLAHNPGAMWRYLALEERKLVTVIDADRALELEGDMARTVETSRVGLGYWRVPVWGEMNVIGKMAYRPMIGGQLGGCKRLPVRRLMEALVWHTRRGSIRTDCDAPGCGPQPIHGTEWPNYGFDEWFVLSAVYPRAAAAGLLSFVPARASSRLLPLDIENVMWANSRSEMVYFGSAGGSCCGGGMNDSKPVPTVTRRAECRVIRLKDASHSNVDWPKKLNWKCADKVKGGLKTCPAGNWLKALREAATGEQTWVAVLAPNVVPGDRAELFMDHRLEDADLSTAGDCFLLVDEALERWAAERGLEAARWQAGLPRRVPHWNGPLTLWRTKLLAKVLTEYDQCRHMVSMGALLAALKEEGKVRAVHTKARTQGWQIRDRQ